MGQARILVAEDEFIIAADLCETVKEAGFSVEGPHADISSAMLACQKSRPDLAILDIRLDDGIVYPLAQKLMDDHVPVIFHSGQISEDEVRSRFPDAQSLRKPCPPNVMIDAVHQGLTEAH